MGVFTCGNPYYYNGNAIRNYMANYAADYGVIDIKIDDIYE